MCGAFVIVLTIVGFAFALSFVRFLSQHDLHSVTYGTSLYGLFNACTAIKSICRTFTIRCGGGGDILVVVSPHRHRSHFNSISNIHAALYGV